jgi:hypothetical protein
MVRGVIQIRVRTRVLAAVAFVSAAILWIVIVGPLMLIILKTR